MSKAEEAALKAYPKETRDISGFVVDIGHPQYMRDLYIEGYHQAEKDLELGWQDIVMIDKLLIDLGMMFPCKSTPDYYQEVLKRFENFKEKKGK